MADNSGARGFLRGTIAHTMRDLVSGFFKAKAKDVIENTADSSASSGLKKALVVGAVAYGGASTLIPAAEGYLSGRAPLFWDNPGNGGMLTTAPFSFVSGSVESVFEMGLEAVSDQKGDPANWSTRMYAKGFYTGANAKSGSQEAKKAVENIAKNHSLLSVKSAFAEQLSLIGSIEGAPDKGEGVTSEIKRDAAQKAANAASAAVAAESASAVAAQSPRIAALAASQAVSAKEQEAAQKAADAASATLSAAYATAQAASAPELAALEQKRIAAEKQKELDGMRAKEQGAVIQRSHADSFGMKW